MNPVLLFLFKCIIYPIGFLYAVGFSLWLLVYFLMNQKRKFWKKIPYETPPACLLNPSLGNHGFMNVQGVNLHYVENGDRSKDLILLIHGFPEFWYSWRYQLKEFKDNYWVIALDLRGFGESEKLKTMSGYKMIKVIEDIRQFVLALGRNKFILIGHDWGGLISWNFLDYYPEMVEKYVIINAPHHKTWINMIATSPKQFISSWYCFFFQMPYLPEFALSMDNYKIFDSMGNYNDNMNPTVTEDDITAYKYMFSKKGALTNSVNYYRANCGELYLKSECSKINSIGLMIFGDQDKYLSVKFLHAAKKLIPNLKILSIKGGGHCVQQDRPYDVNNAIRSFLET